MNAHEIIQLVLYFGLLIGLTPVLGGFMARVFEGQRTFLSGFLGPVEKWIYRLGGVDANQEMTWKRYLAAVLIFNLVGFLATFAQLVSQAALPLNPQKFA